MRQGPGRRALYEASDAASCGGIARVDRMRSQWLQELDVCDGATVHVLPVGRPPRPGDLCMLSVPLALHRAVCLLQ